MNKELEQFYRLELSKDLISFLMHILLVDSTSKKDKVKLIMESWYDRIEKLIKKLSDEMMENYNGTIEEKDQDVLKILIGINQIEPAIIRRDFKDQMMNYYIQQFLTNEKEDNKGG
jgi:succinate dehydrogenase flavin-adding protein (antitoxin of CptAB toxin-antitoxin module)